MMKKYLLLCSLFCLPLAAFSQYAFNKQTNIPVLEGTRTLKMPWAGGLNNPQFSAAHLNNDSILDLVIFDRSGDKAITFLNGGTPGIVDYIYSPEYESAFSGLIQWMLMADFDCDGVEDVFTYAEGGAIAYFHADFDSANHLQLQIVDTLRYPSFSGDTTNIFITSIDIPAFVDVNNDGDLDILTFEQLGAVVGWFENQAQELSTNCDNVLFKQQSTCWGDFYEPQNTNVVVLNSCGGFEVDTCIYALKTGGQAGQRHELHPGSTIMAFDEDGDGDKEIVLGDINYDRLNRLVNGGNPDCADIIDQDAAFPSYDWSYRSPLFPASFYVDVNNDGLRDLLAAPNAPGSENYNCSWYYKNAGTADSVVFDYQTDTFLIHDMLDFGEGAHPVFFDYNGDSLLDLVVGNGGYYVDGTVYRSGLALLENVGTAQSPQYKLINKDYGGLSNLVRENLAPAFGDMDADGDQDMIVGEVDGFLHYYENTAGPGNPATFTASMLNMYGMDVGQFSTPFIYDVNGDGILDLLVGEKSGVINYFENAGRTTEMEFNSTPTNSFFGEIDVRVPMFINGFSAPVISPLDSSGKLYLLSGSDIGAIRVYEFDHSSIYSGAFNRTFYEYPGIDEGMRSSPTIADITGDGKYEMVVGNYRGGLGFFSQSDSVAVSAPVVRTYNGAMEVYPNPATNKVQVNLRGFKRNDVVNITLVDMLGRTLTEVRSVAEQTTLDLPQVSPGMYFIRASQGSNSVMKKLLISAQ